MAEQTATQDTSTTTDTGADDAVDTSTNEESSEADVEDSFEDEGVFDEVDNEEDESDGFEEESEANDESEDAEEESEEDVSEAETEEEQPSDSEDESDNATEDSSLTPEQAEQKRRNDEYAKQRIAAREARKRDAEIKQAQEDVRLEEYLRAAQNDEAELAKRQEEVRNHLQQREFQQERIAMNAERLEVSLDKAIASIDLFRTGSPEVKEALGDAIDQFVNTQVVTDDYGNPIEVRGDLHQHLQREADKIRKLTSVGQRQSVKATTKTKARTQTVPSRAPKQAKVDPMLAAFDEEADR